MIFPAKLRPGSRVALLSPAGPVPPERLRPAVEAVRRLGLEPLVYESCRAQRGYLAGSDELRASDVMRAFLDDAIEGIWCIRGGYGSQRMMNRLDWEAIAAHPKFFGGYSDITALHIMLNQRCGFVSYHMPMPSTEVYKPLDHDTASWMKRALFGSLAGPYKLPEGRRFTRLTGGCARGRLVGGNLSLVVSSLGTDYEIDTCGKLLFLEDVDEAPYRIDGMMQQLAAAGKLKSAAGIILGDWTDCQAREPERSLTLMEVFQDHIATAGVPAVMGLACGHSLPTGSLPLGAMARLDADTLHFVIEEDGV